MMRRVLTSVIAVLMASGLLVGGVATGQATAERAVAPSARETPAATYSRTAIAATNAQRARRDLVRLRKQACLQRKATEQANRMARQRRMFHQNLGPVLRQCGMSMVGENVAYGYPTGRSVVNQGWMHSPGHRANILRREYRLIGLAARRAGGRWYVAQVLGRS
ncbi:CAP domain-containing protein [Nocardioides jensenii]|uniref:CAP domain-containing protein n=1 Tax=Nocardioides jensenii TaxID=1843 RepID=UPI0008365453|nr:CAP domain-containing protein [Nocardioides jensenii]